MGARLQSKMRRLWFLAVLLCLWPFAAQAITRNPVSFVPEQSPKPAFSSRLEQAVPHQSSPSLLVVVRVWPDGRIGIFCGDDPVNYFDPSGLCLERGWNDTKYYGGMAVGTLWGMAQDINTMDAMVDPVNPFYLQVHMQMARQGQIDYLNAGGGWNGGLNAFNRVNPLRSPFEAVSGEHLMEGPQLGERLTGGERATQWANTVSLAASLGTGAPGTMSAVSGDLRALSSFGSLPRTFAPGELMPNGQLAGVGPGAMFRGEPPPSVPLYRGVPGNGTQKAILGQQGVAIPRGTALDEASLTKHVLGEDVNAGVTSWTLNRSVAQRFAGPGGTIIELDLNDVLDQIVPRPNVLKYGAENEVLLKGPIQGTPTTP